MTRHVRRVRGLVVAVLLVLLVAMALEWWSPPWWRRVSYPIDYRAQIKQSASRHGVDPYLVVAVVRVESGFDPEVRSSKGAIGLMQVLPATARYVGRRRGRSYAAADLYRPATNIEVGTYYLKYLQDKYGNVEYALAAYNGGEANVDEWIKGRESEPRGAVIDSIPYKETRGFVRKVLSTRAIYERLYPEVFEK